MPVPRGNRSIAAAAIVAGLFGAVTVVTGSRVLLGADPGYAVYQPLLIFNTLMGLAYLAVGAAAWRRPRTGVLGAAAVFVLNAGALAYIAALYRAGGPVAGESLRAMGFRTLVWLILLLTLVWATRRGPRK